MFSPVIHSLILLTDKHDLISKGKTKESILINGVTNVTGFYVCVYDAKAPTHYCIVLRHCELQN